ncbi:MAG: hypothetical protein WC712_01725 [Candidatus Brocadiia bacterium]
MKSRSLLSLALVSLLLWGCTPKPPTSDLVSDARMPMELYASDFALSEDGSRVAVIGQSRLVIELTFPAMTYSSSWELVEVPLVIARSKGSYRAFSSKAIYSLSNAGVTRSPAPEVTDLLPEAKTFRPEAIPWVEPVCADGETVIWSLHHGGQGTSKFQQKFVRTDLAGENQKPAATGLDVRARIMLFRFPGQRGMVVWSPQSRTAFALWGGSLYASPQAVGWPRICTLEDGKCIIEDGDRLVLWDFAAGTFTVLKENPLIAEYGLKPGIENGCGVFQGGYFVETQSLFRARRSVALGLRDFPEMLYSASDARNLYYIRTNENVVGEYSLSTRQITERSAPGKPLYFDGNLIAFAGSRGVTFVGTTETSTDWECNGSFFGLPEAVVYEFYRGGRPQVAVLDKRTGQQSHLENARYAGTTRDAIVILSWTGDGRIFMLARHDLSNVKTLVCPEIESPGRTIGYCIWACMDGLLLVYIPEFGPVDENNEFPVAEVTINGDGTAVAGEWEWRTCLAFGANMNVYPFGPDCQLIAAADSYSVPPMLDEFTPFSLSRIGPANLFLQMDGALYARCGMSLLKLIPME